MTKQAKLKQMAYSSSLKSRALSVLIYLIDRSNKDLTCFPAIPTMAEQLHISISTVKRALHELVDAGFIKKDVRFREKNRGQTSNLYTLVQPEESPAASESGRDKENSQSADTEQRKAMGTSCEVQHITFANIAASGTKQNTTAAETENMPVQFENKVDKPVHRDADYESVHVQSGLAGQTYYLLSGNQGIDNTELKELCFIYTLWTGEGFSLPPS